jgi:hypothetical protein
MYQHNRISFEVRERRRRREHEAIVERTARVCRAPIRRRLPRLTEALRRLPLHRERLAG